MNEFTHSFLDSSNDKGMLRRPARAQTWVSQHRAPEDMGASPAHSEGGTEGLSGEGLVMVFLHFHFLYAPHRGKLWFRQRGYWVVNCEFIEQIFIKCLSLC